MLSSQLVYEVLFKESLTLTNELNETLTDDELTTKEYKPNIAIIHLAYELVCSKSITNAIQILELDDRLIRRVTNKLEVNLVSFKHTLYGFLNKLWMLSKYVPPPGNRI